MQTQRCIEIDGHMTKVLLLLKVQSLTFPFGSFASVLGSRTETTKIRHFSNQRPNSTFWWNDCCFSFFFLAIVVAAITLTCPGDSPCCDPVTCESQRTRLTNHTRARFSVGDQARVGLPTV